MNLKTFYTFDKNFFQEPDEIMKYKNSFPCLNIYNFILLKNDQIVYGNRYCYYIIIITVGPIRE